MIWLFFSFAHVNEIFDLIFKYIEMFKNRIDGLFLEEDLLSIVPI